MKLRVGLESLGLLAFPNKGDDRFDVFGGQSFDWWHGPELPVVGLNSPHDCDEESAIPVVTGLIYLGKKRWTLIGASQIFTVAPGAIRGVQPGAEFDLFWFGRGVAPLVALPAGGDQNHHG